MIVAGAVIVLLGVVQLVLKRPLQAQQEKWLGQSSEPRLEKLIARPLWLYILVRCLPLWTVGIALIVYALQKA